LNASDPQEALTSALETVKDSEAKLRHVIDAIPTLAWCNLPDGPNEFLYKRWHEYTGRSHEESTGWGWQAAFHPEDIPPLMEKWRELLGSGDPGEMEARLRRHDGVYRWFLIRVEPFRDERGRLVRWYGTSTDIDALKQTQESCAKRNRSFGGLPMRYRRQLSCWTLLALLIREPGDARLCGVDRGRRDGSSLSRTFVSRGRSGKIS
jgi:PAS domain S-box-containing protein